MQVNTASGVPIWRQIADAITEQIRVGELAVGDQLPSTREISEQWDVAMGSAISALAELRKQGLIKTKHGRGSYVAARPLLMRFGSRRYGHSDHLSPTSAELDQQNHPFTIDGRCSTTKASATIAHRLHVTPGDPVSQVDYLWSDERGPIQRSTQYEPLTLTEGTDAEVPPESGHPDVITRFSAIGHHVTRVVEETQSRMPTAAESEELALGEGIPVFSIERTHYAGKLPVETANITIRGDRMVVVMEHHVSKRGGGR